MYVFSILSSIVIRVAFNKEPIFVLLVPARVLINMECRAWAKNIHYKSNAQVREGSVHFELLVDESP